MEIVETAPAKVNFYLHVGPVRRDGLHELASLFVFADFGDAVSAQPADDLSLDIVGPFAGALRAEKNDDNLVMLAARALAEAAGAGPGAPHGARLTLTKRLPVAAGIGGGSADAAAALKALARLWRLNISRGALADIAFRLGADVPACLDAAPVYVTGAGEAISRGPTLPPLWLCLVNPRVPTPTGAVFRAFDAAAPRPPAPALARPAAASVTAFRAMMAASRNDLEPHAIARQAIVSDVVEFLRARPGALAARMSGSGATCFGAFASEEAAHRSARCARANGWWAAAAPLLVGGR